MWRSLPSISQRAKVVKTDALRAVADVALLAVQHPRAVGLEHRARLDVVGVGAGLGLGQREAGELAAGGEVGQEALLLLVGAEQVDALEADRLVDAHHDRERRVDLGERLEDARVAGLREALAAVLLGHVEAAQAAPRRARGRRRRRSSASPRSRAGRCARRSRARPRSAPRTRSCSRGSGCGHGKTISSWISPRNSDLANEDAGARACASACAWSPPPSVASLPPDAAANARTRLLECALEPAQRRAGARRRPGASAAPDVAGSPAPPLAAVAWRSSSGWSLRRSRRRRRRRRSRPTEALACQHEAQPGRAAPSRSAATC